jgi:hypothetical protein
MRQQRQLQLRAAAKTGITAAKTKMEAPETRRTIVEPTAGMETETATTTKEKNAGVAAKDPADPIETTTTTTTTTPLLATIATTTAAVTAAEEITTTTEGETYVAMRRAGVLPPIAVATPIIDEIEDPIRAA